MATFNKWQCPYFHQTNNYRSCMVTGTECKPVPACALIAARQESAESPGTDKQQLQAKIEQAVLHAYVSKFGADGKQGEFAELVLAQLSAM